MEASIPPSQLKDIGVDPLLPSPPTGEHPVARKASPTRRLTPEKFRVPPSSIDHEDIRTHSTVLPRRRIPTHPLTLSTPFFNSTSALYSLPFSGL